MATIHAKAEGNGVLLLTFKGGLANESDTDQFVADVSKVAQAIKQHDGANPKRILILVDMTDFQLSPDSRAFDALVSLAKEDKEIVAKTAIFGGSQQIQTIGQTVAFLAGRENIRFFPDKERATVWLRDNHQ